MLLVIDPVALVLGAVRVSVLAKAVRLIVDPMSVVNIAVGVNKSATTVSLVSLPVTLIDAAIRPNLISFAVLLIRLYVPFAFISCAVRQSHHLSMLLVHIWLVFLILRQSVLELG